MIANLQAHFCNSIANGNPANWRGVDNDKDLIAALSEWAGTSASEVARKAGLAVSTLTRPLNQPVKHRLSLTTLAKLKETYPTFPGFGLHPEQATPPADQDYVPIDVLPTYAGAGGGGTGDGDQETALVARALIVEILRGKPGDFLIINIRGDSMEPDFHHGDQLLVDRRDTSPAQPGPFAIWDGDWGEYVVKNVERVAGGEVRVFSSNAKYSPKLVDAEETRIIGRPVWFGRRL